MEDAASSAGAPGGLQAFLARAGRTPLLRPEEERELAQRYRADGDREAARILVWSHVRLVARVARRYRGYQLPLEDLVSQGMLGLLRALQHFDPDRGVRFSTYALWWVRAEIQVYAMRQWSAVRVGTTASQKKLFFHLRSLKAQTWDSAQAELQPEGRRAVAEALGVAEADVGLMERRLFGRDLSLDARPGDGDDIPALDGLAASEEDPETKVAEAEELAYRRGLVREALNALDGRERHILLARRLAQEPATLGALADTYGVSRERIRQLERRAFTKVRQAVLAAAAAPQGADGSAFQSD